jgi:hypothetical protein
VGQPLAALVEHGERRADSGFHDYRSALRRSLRHDTEKLMAHSLVSELHL